MTLSLRAMVLSLGTTDQQRWPPAYITSLTRNLPAASVFIIIPNED